MLMDSYRKGCNRKQYWQMTQWDDETLCSTKPTPLWGLLRAHLGEPFISLITLSLDQGQDYQAQQWPTPRQVHWNKLTRHVSVKWQWCEHSTNKKWREQMFMHIQSDNSIWRRHDFIWGLPCGLRLCCACLLCFADHSNGVQWQYSYIKSSTQAAQTVGATSYHWGKIRLGQGESDRRVE